MPKEEPPQAEAKVDTAIAPVVVNNLTPPQASHLPELSHSALPRVALASPATANAKPQELTVAAIAPPERSLSPETHSPTVHPATPTPATFSLQPLPELAASPHTPTREESGNFTRTGAIAAVPQTEPIPIDVPPPAELTAQVQIPPATEIEQLQQELRQVQESEPDFGEAIEGSPAITIANPSGYGADNFTGFVNFSYQSRTRYTEEDDGSLGFGIGFGDAEEAVGVQISYTVASFGGSRDFGSGGFNAKLHRQLSEDWSIAVGWEGFLNLGDDNDFEDSIYGAVTHIIRTTSDLDNPFSRIALTAGLGSGRFRTEDAILDGDDTIGAFGSIAVRIARPLSAIVEWTGQDLALGLSVAPFRNFPLVLTPAVRDLAGAGDGARFVLGAGIAFQF